MAMKKSIKTVSLLLSLIFLFFACTDSSNQLSSEEKENFKKVIKDYCVRKQMGIFVSEIRKADIEANKAKLECQMKAEGAGIGTIFNFKLKKNDKGWKVESYSR